MYQLGYCTLHRTTLISKNNKIDEKVEYKIYRKEINQDEVKKYLPENIEFDIAEARTSAK